MTTLAATLLAPTHLIAFSGGIDSTSLALLYEDATPIFTDTGDEFDELYAHLDKFEQVTGRKIVRIKNEAHKSLPEYEVAAKFFPNHGARFCTRMFKIEPMNDWIGDRPSILMIGLRADEPADERVGNLTDKPNLTIDYPLRRLGWTRAHCVNKCLEYGLLPRYPVYMARGGCKSCFYKRKSEIRAMAHLAPQIMDELQAREELVQDERGAFFHIFPNIDMSIRQFRANEAAQPTLFDEREVWNSAVDRSEMGQTCGLLCNR